MLFIGSVCSAQIGLDIGSEYVRVATIRPNSQLDIVTNSDGKRYFPSIMTVRPKKDPVDFITEQNFDDFTFYWNDVHASRKYPQYTIHHWSNYLAKYNYSEFYDLLDARVLLTNTSELFYHRLMTAGITPETLFYINLYDINQSLIALDSHFRVSIAAIAVPKFYTQQERNALRSVARARKYNPRIVEQSRALATYFAVENHKTFQKKKVTVAFFDFGASNIQATICEFSKSPGIRVKEIAYRFVDYAGGRDLDIALMELLKANYTEPLSPRAEQVLIEEANKVKQRLTTDLSVTGHIEIPDSQNELQYTITRREFEQAIEDYLNIARQMIMDIILKKDGTKIELDRVQMIGGCSRIPCVQEMVKGLTGADRVLIAMNAEDAIALGAAYYAASCSSDYKMVSIAYEPLAIYNVSIRTREEVFPFDMTIPRPGKAHWLFEYASHYPLGSTQYIEWVETNTSTTIRQTKDGLYRFVNGSKFEKPWKKLALGIGKKIRKQQKAKKKLDETVNKLESLLLETKNLINSESGVLMSISTQRERDGLQMAVKVIDRWFLNQREFHQDTVDKKYNQLIDAVGAVMCRAQNIERLPSAVTNMTKLFKKMDKVISSIWAIKDEDKQPRRKELRRLLRQRVNLEIWYEECRERQELLQPTDNPALRWYQLRDRTNDLAKKFSLLKEFIDGGRKKPKQDQKDMYVYPPDSTNVEYL